MGNVEKNLDDQMEFGFTSVPAEKDEETQPAEMAVDAGEAKPKTLRIEDDEERDCPACGGSGPCNACERGRAVIAEFREATRRAKEETK